MTTAERGKVNKGAPWWGVVIIILLLVAGVLWLQSKQKDGNDSLVSSVTTKITDLFNTKFDPLEKKVEGMGAELKALKKQKPKPVRVAVAHNHDTHLRYVYVSPQVQAVQKPERDLNTDNMQIAKIIQDCAPRPIISDGRGWWMCGNGTAESSVVTLSAEQQGAGCFVEERKIMCPSPEDDESYRNKQALKWIVVDGILGAVVFKDFSGFLGGAIVGGSATLIGQEIGGEKGGNIGGGLVAGGLILKGIDLSSTSSGAVAAAAPVVGTPSGNPVPGAP